MSPVPSIRLTLCLAAAFILVSCSAPPNTTGVTAPSPCKMEETPVGSIFTLVKFMFSLNANQAKSPPREIAVVIQPGPTGESAQVTCPGVGGNVGDVIPPGPRWHEVFEFHHGKKKIGEGLYFMGDWNIAGGELLATKLFESQTPSVGGS